MHFFDHVPDYVHMCCPTELKAGFSNDVHVMLDEGNVESVCVTVEGSTERHIDDIVVNGMLCVFPQNTSQVNGLFSLCSKSDYW